MTFRVSREVEDSVRRYLPGAAIAAISPVHFEVRFAGDGIAWITFATARLFPGVLQAIGNSAARKRLEERVGNANVPLLRVIVSDIDRFVMAMDISPRPAPGDHINIVVVTSTDTTSSDCPAILDTSLGRVFHDRFANNAS
jgi:hypothetical protein